MEFNLNDWENRKVISTLGSKPRTQEEIDNVLKYTNFAIMQCAMRRNQAYLENDPEAMWIMEAQRVTFLAIKQAVRWTVGLESDIYDAGEVAMFLKENNE